MIEPFKKKTLTQMKKAQGVLNRVIAMIEEDRYCIDILQQSMAAVGTLKSANKTILENHLNSCFKGGMKSKSSKKQQELIDEVLRVVNKS